MSASPLAARRDLLALVLDTLVPASDGFPAGSVALDHVLAMAAASADVASVLERALQAIGDTAAKSTSPASLPSGSRLTPTSITVAPGLTCRAPTRFGRPAATTTVAHASTHAPHPCTCPIG